MSKCLLLVVLIFLGMTPADAFLFKGGGNTPATTYTPLCGGSNPTCVSALSTERQLVTGAPKAIQVYRTVDGTTQDVGFTGAGLVNTSTVDAFCNASVGGVISRNCLLSEVYNQTGTTGCSVYNNTVANYPNYQVDPNHQDLPIFKKVFQGSGGHTFLLDNNGGATTAVVTPCADGLTGSTAQSFFYAGNSSQASNCCGNFGHMENTVGVVTGAMFSAMAGITGLSFGVCSSGSPNQCGGMDSEAASGALANFVSGTNGDYIDQITSAGSTGPVNLWINGTQLVTNQTTTHPFVTQSRMTWGTAGDGTGAGPSWGRTIAFYLSALNSSQITATYNNETSFVAALTAGYAGPGDLFQQNSSTPGLATGHTNQLQWLSICFSLRKCYAGYEGPALNVCQGQGSGATCEDIGFVGAAIDTATMSAFCGPVSGLNNCAAQIWYNQALPPNSTSNSQITTYDAVASSNTTRPTIAWSGCQTTTIPVCVVTGGSSYFLTSANPGADGGTFTISAVAQRTSGFTSLSAIYGFQLTDAFLGFNNATNTCIGNVHAGGASVTATCSDSAVHSITLDTNSSGTTIYVDGAAGGTVVTTTSGLETTAVGVGAITSGADVCACQLSEVDLFAGFTGGTYQGISSGGVAALRANQQAAFGF